MLVYIIKSTACLAILFLFYKLFLEKENMHVFKRFYLLGALFLSLIIPALVFTEYVVADPTTETSLSEIQPVVNSNEVINIPPALEADVLDVSPILWTIYFFGLFFFGLKFIRNLFQIFRRIRKNPKQKLKRYTQVLLHEIIPPHTFFSYIFLNKKKLESNEIPKEVLLHEETHARQRHSYDVVLVEFLQVIFWVNPLIYFLKKAIKLNHEFLADQAVLKKNIDKFAYQNTLLSYLSPDSEKKYQPKLANAINYSSIKKRFIIMKTHTSKRAIYLRTLLLIPLLAFLLLGFSETKLIEVTPNYSEELLQKASEYPREYAEDIQININKKGQLIIQDKIVAIKDLKVFISEINENRTSEENQDEARYFIDVETESPKKVISEVNQILTEYGAAIINIVGPNQEGASRKLMAEYNKLAKYYNEMQRNRMKIQKKDVERLEYIFSLMSEKQKADAEPFPDFPPMPDPPKAPKALKPVKGEKSDIPPPPPAPNQKEMEEIMELHEEIKIREQEDLLEKEEAKLVEQEILMEQQEIKLHEQEVKMKEREAELEEIEEKTEKVYRVTKERDSDIPEPPEPPSPETPLDHAIEMAKQGATFYYKKKQISSDEAIAILKKNEDLSMDISKTNNETPVVKIDTHF